jgi:hypothetical protein
MEVLFFAAYVKPSTYPDDESSNLAQCFTKKTAFLSHRRSNGMLLTPSLGAFSARYVTIRHIYVGNVCVRHHTIPKKDVTAVNRHSLPSTYGGHGCVKRCANIAVDISGVIPLVFKRICIPRAPVNVASTVRTRVTTRETPERIVMKRLNWVQVDALQATWELEAARSPKRRNKTYPARCKNPESYRASPTVVNSVCAARNLKWRWIVFGGKVAVIFHLELNDWRQGNRISIQ